MRAVNVAERIEAWYDQRIALARKRSTLFDHGWRAKERFDDVLGGRLAAAISYYGFFAAFSLAVVAYSILGRILNGSTSAFIGTVNSYLSSFTDRRLPILIGEFSGEHQWGDPDEDAIMAYCRAHGLGYFAWSWSGNSPQYAYLDLVSGYRPGRLTPWGRRLVDGPDGLRATSRPAGVFERTWLAAAG